MRELPGVLSYVLLAALLLWLLFRSPLPDSTPDGRLPKWVPAAVFALIGVGVLAGITYELFVKKVAPPCPCGVPGCPEPPACSVIHEQYTQPPR